MKSNRRGFLKALGIGAITSPAVAEDYVRDDEWHSGKLERLVRTYCRKPVKVNLCDGAITIPGYASLKSDEILKTYEFVLTDNNGNGIIRFSKDAIAAKKVILDDFKPFCGRSITARMRKQKQEKLPVKYMIDDKFVIHLRFENK